MDARNDAYRLLVDRRVRIRNLGSSRPVLGSDPQMGVVQLEGRRMKITLTDKEVRNSIEAYVRIVYAKEFIHSSEVTVLRITRHHGGTVTADVKVDPK